MSIRSVPPWAWVVLVGIAGVSALAYHSYANDDDDTSWEGSATDVQPPAAVAFPASSGALPGCADPCRAPRTYPGSLIDAEFSLIGRG